MYDFKIQYDSYDIHVCIIQYNMIHIWYTCTYHTIHDTLSIHSYDSELFVYDAIRIVYCIILTTMLQLCPGEVQRSSNNK